MGSRKAGYFLISALALTAFNPDIEETVMAHRDPSFTRLPASEKVVAVLGPTNTGKTHLAVERLCGHSSGLIGFPLRLLAREVYDRVCAVKGPEEVALITGEERIVPDGARWVLATVESMPMSRDFAFVAIDEAQLGADPERGHVFTDRLLHARGREETMILGSDSLRPMIEALLPEAEIISRPRFSTLSYGGHKKLSRLPPRTAIVAFSAEEVYATAELLKRFRGGAAVVMGALSPRTRNAQVDMFQSGEVDYLVATDAIGMGLNMDVHHVAFAALRKFDGRRQRRLTIAEMAQIAGRAGRHQRNGTFGTLAASGSEAAHLSDDEISRIEGHDMPPLSSLYWREAEPDYHNVAALIDSLQWRPGHDMLRAAPEATDLAVLQRLVEQGVVTADAHGAALVQRLWAVCGLPDFRQLGIDHHARFVAGLWRWLEQGMIPVDHAARKLDEIDRTTGDVGMLAGRLAAIRSWAYIAHRADWVADRAALAARAEDIEERLSEALHKALTERFVDRRAAILMRRLAQDSSLMAVAIEDDVVQVEGEPIGRLDGFRFVVGSAARLADRKLLLAAAERHLPRLLQGRVTMLAGDDDNRFVLSDADALCWRDARVARLQRGAAMLRPAIVPDRSLMALDAAARQQIEARLQRWLDGRIAHDLKPLLALAGLADDPEQPATLRAMALQLCESGGCLSRKGTVPELPQALDPDQKKLLRRHGVVFGTYDIFVARLNAVRARQLLRRLVALWGRRDFAKDDAGASLAPVLLAAAPDDPAAAHAVMGYRRFGGQRLRVDLCERLVRAAHEGRHGSTDAFAIDDALARSMGLSETSFAKLLHGAGFRKTVPPDTGGKSDEAATVESGETGIIANEDAPVVQYWRWKGLRARSGKPGRKAQRPADAESGKKQMAKARKPGRKSTRNHQPAATGHPAFAVLKDMMK
ncbi:MAG: helicase-related protein [Pseudomonadota bacterium]